MIPQQARRRNRRRSSLVSQFERAAARPYLPGDLRQECLEPLGAGSTARLIVLCEWWIDRELIADEERERFKADMTVARQAIEQIGDAVEPEPKAIVLSVVRTFGTFGGVIVWSAGLV